MTTHEESTEEVNMPQDILKNSDRPNLYDIISSSKVLESNKINKFAPFSSNFEDEGSFDLSEFLFHLNLREDFINEFFEE